MDVLLNLDNLTKKEQNDILNYLKEKKVVTITEKTLNTMKPLTFYQKWANEQNSVNVQWVYNKIYALIGLDELKHFTNKILVEFNEEGNIIEIELEKKGETWFNSIGQHFNYEFEEEILEILNNKFMGEFYDSSFGRSIERICEEPRLVFETEL
jgi:hypothetical protein